MTETVISNATTSRSKQNVDFNDVLVKGGMPELKRQLAKNMHRNAHIQTKKSSAVIVPNQDGTNSENILVDGSGLFSLDDLHKLVLSKAKPEDFKELIDRYTCPGNHEQYLKNGILKIPAAVIAVIVNKYTFKLIDTAGLSIAQFHSNDAEIKISYLFNGKYWVQISECFIKALFRDVLIVMGHDLLQSQTARLADLLVKTFWANAPKSPTTSCDRVLINLKNTTLEIMPNGIVKQHKHHKDNFMLYCLHYNYDNNAQCPLFIKFLDRVLPDKESQVVLQELLGSIFIKNINFEKLGILFGSGCNGKSVLLKVITELLGHNNVSHMDLKSLTMGSNADNNRTQLMGKLLNFAPEINAKGELSHDLIKRMASGEAIQGKLLFKDTFTFSNYAKLIFNANKLPRDVEHTFGFFRRFLIIVFDQVISESEKDPELANKMIDHELPGILNWIMEGTKRLQCNKKFSPCKKSDDMLEQYKLDSDVVAQWIAERGYTTSEDMPELLTDLFNDFLKFTSENGYTSRNTPIARVVAERLRTSGFKQRKGKPAAFYINIHVNVE